VVSNTNDDATNILEGTLRKAISNANIGQCGKIVFSIPSNIDNKPTIQLSSPLPSITSSYIIDGSTQANYAIVKNPVVKVRGTRSIPAPNIQESDVTIKGLYFEEFINGISINSSRTTLEHLVIGKVDYTYMNIGELISQNKISNCYLGKSMSGDIIGQYLKLAPGLSISGKENVFDNVHVANTWVQNVLYGSKASGNKIIGGSFTKSGLADKSKRKAFSIPLNAQANVKVPAIISHQFISENRLKLIINAGSDGLVQVYQSDNEPQQAINFITPQSSVFNTLTQSWELIFNNQVYNPDAPYYFVATYTDTQNNTSELSNNYRINSPYERCIVNTLAENGLGSFREAVSCVNASDSKAGIYFDLVAQNNNIINLTNTQVVITNALGVKISPLKEQNVEIRTSNSVTNPLSFNFTGTEAIVQNMKFDRLNINITNGLNHHISKSIFSNSVFTFSANATNSKVLENQFLDNARLVVNAAQRIQVSKNTFLNPNVNSNSVKAITLSNSGNNGKKVPSAKLLNVKDGIMTVEIEVENLNETIELFLGSPNGQRATQFVSSYSLNDANKKVIELDLRNLIGENVTSLSFVATATDALGNTSELSPNLISTCFISNNRDTDENGTLRSAIKLINDNKCSAGFFRLDYNANPANAKIKLTNALPIIEKSAIIDATTFQQGYDKSLGKPVVKISPSSSSKLSYLFSAENILSVNGLSVNNFTSGLMFSSALESMSQVNNLELFNCDKGIVVANSKGFKAESCTFGDSLNPNLTNLTAIEITNSAKIILNENRFFMKAENSIGVYITGGNSNGDMITVMNNKFSGVNNFDKNNQIVGVSAYETSDKNKIEIQNNRFVHIGAPIIANRSLISVLNNKVFLSSDKSYQYSFWKYSKAQLYR
jgi:hypothetical protein